MGNLELQAETNLLLAKQIIRRNNCSFDVIEWALLLMEKGYCSHNLYILAGLGTDEIWEIEAYFEKTIADFGINSSFEKQDLLDFYLIYHIKRILDNSELLTDDIIRLLAQVIDDTSYKKNKHLCFFYLYDELEELTGLDRKEYAIREFTAFINELKIGE